MGNIFDHSIASGDGDGNNGVLLGTGHSAISIVDNLFFDAEGPLQFMDEDDGGVTDLASFNAKSYAEGNIEALPNFVDTTRAPTRPYYSGVTLKPLSISPALNLGLWTRTAGAMPCGNCPTFGLSASGFVSDSAHVVWFDRNGVSGGFRYDAGLAPAAARGAWWVDVLPDSTAAGTLRATFSLFTGGDSLVAFDQVEIPHYPPALAEIIRDTVWAEPWIDHLGDQDMGSIVTDTHTRIASSGVRIARESTPAGAGVGELADSVWTRSDGRTLTPGAIVDETFADESIGMRALADPCIMSAEIGSGAIDADAIAADAIGASEIAADAVGAPEIATGAIGAAEIADNAIDAGAIAADAIGAAEVAAGTIGAAEVADGAIDAATFAAGAIDVAAIATDAIGAAEIAAGAIDEGAFATDAISARVIGNEAIGSSELKTGAIDADAIAADALGASELAADAVGEIGAAVDAQLSGTHGTGTWGAGVGLGGGLYTHTVHVVESGSGANIPGARLTVRDIPHTGGELADATTGTSGALTLHLDAGTYRAIASLPIAYNPATADFTVSAPGGDTTTVILTGLELPATGDPDRVALYYDTFDLWGETVDSMLVEVALMRTSPVYFGAELMESSWTMVDTTGTAPDDGIGPATPGRASAAIVRTSELQPMTTYKFRTRDLSTVRRLAGTLKTYPEVTGVTAPDSTSAGVAFNGR
ncbi:MAG: hypothetical protein A2V88_00720 [Elusimicrobia bacterium RBG_16_66_12]|nr:MAG: hypothetical protein A2V88_00720 [Elusimicrobia bacterium RBG_16_66_12]